MKISSLTLIAFLLTPLVVFGQDTRFAGTLVEGDPTLEFLDLFGISEILFVKLSAVIFFVIEAIKRSFPAIFVGGWKTHVATIIVSFLLALKALPVGTVDQWINVVILTAALWLFPAGTYSLGKRIAENRNVHSQPNG